MTLQNIANTGVVSSESTVMELTADIVAAYVSNSQVPVEEIAHLIRTVHDGLVSLKKTSFRSVGVLAKNPACPIEESVQQDYLVCLEDGKHLQVLKRHLKTSFGLSVEEYKRRWGLPSDYPTVSPNYSARRSGIARNTGLGNTPKKRKKLPEVAA